MKSVSAERAMQVFTIYIGLNDKNTYQQIVDSKTFIEIIKNVCAGYHTAYSIHLQKGGYISETGEYVQEDSAVLTLIGVPQKEVDAIAGEICTFFNQEQVLIEKRSSAYYTVS